MNQWELEGNCELCRRKNYCHSLCKKAYNKAQREIEKKVYERMSKDFGEELALMTMYGPYSERPKLNKER